MNGKIKKRDNTKLSELEKLPLSREFKDSLYSKYDKAILRSVVKYYFLQKNEPDSLSEYLKLKCEQRLEKRQKSEIAM